MTLDVRPSPRPVRDPLVIVHCGAMSGTRLDKRVRQVRETLPGAVDLTVTVLGRPAVTTPALRRVDVAVISDGGARLLADSVSSDRMVVVIPFGAQVERGWYEEVLARAAAHPDHIGVIPLGDEHLFVYPAAVRLLDAPRRAWTAVAGLSRRHDHASLRPRTLAAVLIVKDEERVLQSCLEAVRPLVDEILVYDTGSSDATRAIAAAAGARVVCGYWDDDFGGARNRALSHCEADWVFSIDADEIVEAEVTSLRRWVDAADGTVALVDIVSTDWEGARDGHRSRSVRLFQREHHGWAGSLHEQVVTTTPTVQSTACTSLPPVTIFHSGYRDADALVKGKRDRNLEISRLALTKLDPASMAWGDACVDYGRSLALGGRLDECMAVLSEVLDHQVSAPQLVQASRTVLGLLLNADRVDEAEAWVERVQTGGEAPGRVAIWRSQIIAKKGDIENARAILTQLIAEPGRGGTDLWGQRLPHEAAAVALTELELTAGFVDEAWNRALVVLEQSPDTAPIVLLMRATLSAGHQLSDLAHRAPAAFIARTAREIFTVCPDVALMWFAACREVLPADPSVIVGGSIAAARTGVPEALAWAMHAREVGVDVCALELVAEDREVPVSARLSAYALLLHGFLQESVRRPLSELMQSATEEERKVALRTLRTVNPLAADLLTPPAGGGKR
ncbi:glycosyltransferase family 2 protein [Quadrisphaera sp. INWT6]|uniref:glycosyltransferase family 2 protein n=1 Tax=Quadrisphaera sp. INWT6 TaxID=2596917 RepID=UPI0018923990|nr:glycosyltransferase family 2 protein [Quadrisphaera sp. INWT6]MBF5083138.1 glycosyltransferase family 2 protein [Quadrisphaera sp. INWT6]